MTTAFGLWLILGLFTDGWAHLNLTGLETFFTPWHGVLYSGFTAGALWLGVLALRGRMLGLPWLPAVLSLTLVTAVVAFFLLHVSVFTGPAAGEALTRIPEGMPGHEAAELAAVAGLAGYVITTVLLVAPLLLAQRVGRRPRGAVVLPVGSVSWLSAAVAGLTAYGMVVAVALAAFGVEVVAAMIDRSRLPSAARLTALAVALPALLWPAQLLAVAVTGGVRWPVELWSGVVVLSVLVAAALGAVVG